MNIVSRRDACACSTCFHLEQRYNVLLHFMKLRGYHYSRIEIGQSTEDITTDAVAVVLVSALVFRLKNVGRDDWSLSP